MLIVFDFDDVICDHTLHRIKLAKEIGFSVRKEHTPPFVMKQKIGKDRYEEIAEKLYARYTLKAKPSPGIRSVLQKLRDNHRLMIMTERGEREKPFAMRWLAENKLDHFFEDKIFTARQIKRPFLEKLKAEVFIENSWANLLDLPSGIIKILYNRYGIQIPEKFDYLEVRNLREVLPLILGK